MGDDGTVRDDCPCTVSTSRTPSTRNRRVSQARADVFALGGAQAGQRTPEQTQIAHYWSDAIGTYAPAGHWNAIAASIAEPLRLGLSVEAELFAELNVAIADAGIAMADAKFHYSAWRPITAIRSGDSTDPPMPDWTPLLETPAHPSYVSGHSSFSGAAAAVLTTWFGNRKFTFASADSPGVIEGCALDNLAPVTAVTVILDGGAPFNVPVDERGLFSLSHRQLGLPGRHEIVLAATSASGRTSTVRISIE